MGISSAINKYMFFTFGDWTTEYAKQLCGKNGLTKVAATKNNGIWANSKTAYQKAMENSLKESNCGLTAKTFSYGKYAKGMMSGWSKEISTGFKGGAWKGVKGTIGSTMKRMPLIGTVISLAFEVPNLYKSFTDKDGGIGTGTVETGKTAIKLGAFAGGAAVGAAIGTACFPGVGTVVGGVIGFVSSAIGGMVATWGADKFVGKSFTEKKEETEALRQQNDNQTLAMNSARVNNNQGAPTSFAGQNPFAQQQGYGANPFAMYNQMQQFQPNFLNQDIMSFC